MKRLFIITLTLLTFMAIPAFCEDEDSGPLLEIPVLKGAELTTEMNVEREQIPEVLPLLLSQSGSDFEIDSKKLDKALGTIKRIQYAEMVVKGKFTSAKILEFFEKSVNGKRVVYDLSKGPDRGTLIIALPERSGYFGVSIKAEKDKNNKITGAKIKAVKMFGCPDAVKMAELLAPVMPEILEKDLGRIIGKVLGSFQSITHTKRVCYGPIVEERLMEIQ